MYSHDTDSSDNGDIGTVSTGKSSRGWLTFLIDLFGDIDDVFFPIYFLFIVVHPKGSGRPFHGWMKLL